MAPLPSSESPEMETLVGVILKKVGFMMEARQDPIIGRFPPEERMCPLLGVKASGGGKTSSSTPSHPPAVAAVAVADAGEGKLGKRKKKKANAATSNNGSAAKDREVAKGGRGNREGKLKGATARAGESDRTQNLSLPKTKAGVPPVPAPLKEPWAVVAGRKCKNGQDKSSAPPLSPPPYGSSQWERGGGGKKKGGGAKGGAPGATPLDPPFGPRCAPPNPRR